MGQFLFQHEFGPRRLTESALVRTLQDQNSKLFHQFQNHSKSQNILALVQQMIGKIFRSRSREHPPFPHMLDILLHNPFELTLPSCGILAFVTYFV